MPKWNLNHIPSEAKDLFSDEVVPLVKAKVGTMAPWATINLKDLQIIVDGVYGQDVYDLQAGDAWTGLMSYRLQSWRNRFASKASEAVARYFEDPKNNLLTAEARLEAVMKWLAFEGTEGEETAAYQFKKCVYDEDDIRRTRAHDPPHKQPIGAMILSLQAVEHALREYEDDGTRDEGGAGQFLFDNYGDCTTVKEVNGCTTRTFDPRASRYIAPIRGLEERHWKKIFHDAQEVLAKTPKGRKKGRGSASTLSSEADHEHQYVKEFVIKLDSELSGSSDDGDDAEDSDARRRGSRDVQGSDSAMGDSDKENMDPRAPEYPVFRKIVDVLYGLSRRLRALSKTQTSSGEKGLGIREMPHLPGLQELQRLTELPEDIKDVKDAPAILLM
ncbi:hypothetical protein H0H92_002080 [Tricholoma furcatifolium]|nr:hypothetical protein H0H92_002080 [Tricholoma furcatifolium]